MSTRTFGAPLRRLEDERLLTGNALFIDDVDRPRMLHVAFLRSPFAHGHLRSIDLSPALRRPGVVAAFAAGDLGDYWQHGPLLVPPPPIEGAVFHARTQVPLARGKVRCAGEPLAVVVAESRYLAEDAVADILYDIDPLDAVVDLEAALGPGVVTVHDDLDSNLAADVRQTKGDYAAARARADLVIARRFRYDHGTAAALENRGVVADWDRRDQRLTVWDTTQAPIPIQNGLAGLLGLAASQVRVIAPFIGGGFGPKIMMFYPEEMLVPWLAMRLGVPVKWIEDREENFFATTHERDQIHDAEIALDREGHVLGVRDDFLHDTGAYNPYGLTVPINSQCTLLGPYLVPNYDSRFRAVFTNKTIVTPYRGAGRQHGVFVMERLLDLGARELGLDSVEIRRRNAIPKDDFPHHHEIIYQDFSELVYDSGDYLPAIEKARDMIGWGMNRPNDESRGQNDQPQSSRAEGRGAGGPADGLRGEQEQSRAARRRDHRAHGRVDAEEPGVDAEEPGVDAEERGAHGRKRGLGLVCYVEGTGIGPYEGARVTVEPGGTVSVATGIGTQGQGHFTAFAQVVAEQLGIGIERVRVVTGDTDVFHWGTGTFASRGAVVAGNACHAAAVAVRAKILEHASDALEVATEDLELVDGTARVKGAPQRAIDFASLAQRANPLRGAVVPGTEPGLEATAYFGPEHGATASGVHAMEVAVDPETFDVEILRYIVVHDCGTVINPLILDGQIKGGVAQGIGNAFYEQLVYDDQGQLQNASFMDYLLPTAAEVPPIETAHLVTPSPLNPLGTKGAGEAGAIPTGALFAQAVENALRQDLPALEILEIPLSPSRLWELATAARSKGGA